MELAQTTAIVSSVNVPANRTRVDGVSRSQDTIFFCIMELKALIFTTVTATLWHKAVAQVYELIYEDITVFPSDIPANTVEIGIIHTNLSIVPEDAFDDFFQLVELVISKSQMTEMPNLIPVGDTLETLKLSFGRITQLNATVYNALTVLKALTLEGNPLASFPDVPVGPRGSLFYLQLRNCQFTSLIRVAPYAKLSRLGFMGNPIVGEIVEEDLLVASNLHHLIVGDTGVISLPESPTLMDNLATLDISATDVSILLYFSSSPNFQLRIAKLPK